MKRRDFGTGADVFVFADGDEADPIRRFTAIDRIVAVSGIDDVMAGPDGDQVGASDAP